VNEEAEFSPADVMNERKPDIIEDKKPRGEWAESVFMARAQEQGLPVSKPWGEMCPYDFVVGTTGRFVSVQVKSTLSKLETGYTCSVLGGHRPYPAGSFDFLTAYVIPADAWYIIPAKLIQGKRCITLFPNSPKAKYEPYRDARHLMREAIAAKEGTNEDASNAEEPAEPERLPRNALERMEASFRFMKRRLER
jgi:hypothetical protein